MQEREIPPFAPVLMESTRAIGYSLEAAVADIIDNSIAAKAGKAKLFFFPTDAYVCILDDGIGMDDRQIDKAMQYGSKSPADEREATDLGRYGLGLKTASLSQCRVLTVVSKQGSSIAGRRWDLDHVKETGKWSLLVLEEEDIDAVPRISDLKMQKSGTLVVWQKLDRLFMGEKEGEKVLGRKMDEVRQHLSLVFHRYISGDDKEIKRLKIFLNHEEIKGADPFLLRKSTPAMDAETFMILGKKILVRPYILPHISKMTEKEKEMLGGKEDIRKQQGFYVYRNKRLLIWGTWFRMMRQGELSKLARIMVDIPNDLDDLWTLDIKKSQAVPPAEVKENLKAIIQRIADKSKHTWTYRGKKETSDTVEHIWTRLKTRNRGIAYEINRNHPLVEQILSEAPAVREKVELLLKYIERGIPLNQLYVDLNNDEKIENDSEIEESEAKKMMEQILGSFSSSIQRLEMLEKMEHIAPFCEHPDLIRKMKEREKV